MAENNTREIPQFDNPAFNRQLAKKNAAQMLANRKRGAQQSIEQIFRSEELTEEQKKAIAAGTARAWFADLPGRFVDYAASAIGGEYGLIEGMKSIMPSKELTGYDLGEELGLSALQRGITEKPFLGSKHLAEVGEKAGYIPPATGMPEEESARMLSSLVSPATGVGGVIAGVTGKAAKGTADAVSRATRSAAAKATAPKIIQQETKLKNPLKVPADAAERMERKLKRAADVKKGKKVPGGHKNEPIILKPKTDKTLPPIQIGVQTTKSWTKKVEGALTRKDIIEAGGWYRSNKMIEPFLRTVGPALTPEIQAGFMLGATQKSPPGALLAYLKQREQALRGVSFEERKKSGTNDLPLFQLAMQEEVTGGAGQKIYDFVDSGLGNKERTFYGLNPKAGEPFVVDRHTARDMGLIDETFLKWLEENYKIPKGGLVIDFEGAPAETTYEVAGDLGRKITKELNKAGWGEKYGLGELSALDVQAIGWAAMSRLYNQPGEDAALAIAKNVQRVSAALEFGDGSPLEKEYGERYAALSIEKQYEVTRKGLDWVSDRANELSGTLGIGRVHGSGAWKNFPQEPAMVENLLASPGGADLYASIVGYLANQTEVWAVRGVSEGAKDSNGIMIDILEVGSNEIEKGENLQAVWEKLNAFNPEVFQGYQPLVKEDQSGIRLILPFKSTVGKDIDEETGKLAFAFETKTALRKYIDENKSKLTEVLNSVFPDEISFTIKNFDANIRFLRNDWKENENGESYLLGISERAGGGFAESLRDTHRPEFETFLQGLFDTTESTTGEETGVPRTEYTGLGVTPESVAHPSNSPPTSRTAIDKAQAKSDAQTILSQTDEPLHRTLRPETGSVWDDSGYEAPFFNPEGSTEVIPLSPKSLLEKDFDLSQELLIADKTAENITTKKKEIIGNIVLHKNTQPDEGPYRITHFYKGADPGSLEPKSHLDYPNLEEALKAFANLSDKHGGLKLIRTKQAQ